VFKALRHVVSILVKKGEFEEMSRVYDQLLESIPKVTSEWREERRRGEEGGLKRKHGDGVENDAKEAVDQVLLLLKDSSELKLVEKIYNDTAEKLRTIAGQEVRRRTAERRRRGMGHSRGQWGDRVCGSE